MDKTILISLPVEEFQALIVDSVNACLKFYKPPQGIENPDKLLTIEEAGKFLHLTRASIYSKVSRGEIPHMKRGKRLFFSTKDLIEWMKASRVQTNDEIKAEAEDYLKPIKKKGGRQ